MRSSCATVLLTLVLGISAYIGPTAPGWADGTITGGAGLGGQINHAPQDSDAAGASGKTEKEKPKDFTLTLGLGVGVAPDYEGSDNYHVVPVPNIEASWKDRLFISNTSLSVAAISTSYLKAGPMISYEFGRSTKDNHALKGLGKVGDSVEIGGFVDVTVEQWHFGAKLAQDVADGHDGAIGQVDIGYSLPLGERFTLTTTGSMVWASKSYMQSYFGVSSHQSSKSGLSRFNAGSGVKNLDLSVVGTYAFSEHWQLSMIASYSRLLGDAADSPIVKDEGSPNQFVTAIGLSYSF